jgi:hypothetical protein
MALAARHKVRRVDEDARYVAIATQQSSVRELFLHFKVESAL